MKENRLAMRKEVLTQLRNDAVDQEQLKKVFNEHKAKADETISLLIARLSEFHSTLSPEQKEKLVKHFEVCKTIRRTSSVPIIMNFFRIFRLRKALKKI